MGLYQFTATAIQTDRVQRSAHPFAMSYGRHEMAAIRGRIDPGRETPAGDRGQIMKMLTSVDLFAPAKRARKEWFERAKLVIAAARDCAVERAQQREVPPMKRPPTLLQRRRLAKGWNAKT
jgi:hypothetical protein